MTAYQFTKRRQKLFPNQAQAAEAMGVTPGNISHWETGRRPVPRYAEIILECIEGARKKTSAD